ncbi:MAG TPA: hypothetical protein PLJ66_02610 [Methanofastidiosum sp.]|nr:hypothetical protein [Methanofastidiosum sp.]
MDSPLHSLKLLDKEQTKMNPMLKLSTLVILSELAIISKTISTVFNTDFLLKYNIENDFTILNFLFFVLVSLTILFVYKNYFRSILVNSKQYINMEMI